MEKTKETLESIKTMLEAYKNIDNIPISVWRELSHSFIELVDEGNLPFDNSLVKLSSELLNIVMEVAIEQLELDSSKEEDREYASNIYKGLNKGFLYGFSLGKLVYDDKIKIGEVV